MWVIVHPGLLSSQGNPPIYKAMVIGKNKKILGTSCVIKQLACVNSLGKIYKNLPLRR
jgi:hypothetical protein